jgi:hypothetical protein
VLLLTLHLNVRYRLIRILLSLVKRYSSKLVVNLTNPTYTQGIGCFAAYVIDVYDFSISKCFNTAVT